MGFFEKLAKSKGGFIFISHSHNDIDKVRKIRNDLEKEGFEPLCFYLKCMEDADELASLIQREIDAREWFVFVDSENARSSKWVNMERAYISSKDSKKILTIPLDDEDAIGKVVEKITHNLRVFISHSNSDYPIADRIRNKMEQKDYLVYAPTINNKYSLNYMDIQFNAVKEASQEGCVLALISKHNKLDGFVQWEVDLALRDNGTVIPVFLGDIQLDPKMEWMLKDKQHFRLPENPTDQDLDRMIERIGQMIVQK